MRDRGQSGIEYIIVTGFALLALTPIFYLLYNSVQGYESETTSAQCSSIGREIFATAERVYHSGPPSRLTIEVRVPNGVQDVIIRRHNTVDCTKCTEMLFTLRAGGEVVESTDVNVTGLEPPVTDGDSTIYNFNESFINPGTRRFTLEAFPGYVQLRQS